MIMKNYFMKSSMMLMTVSAVLASCTQEEIVQNDVPTRQALNISVNTQDFVSEDGSRATTGIDAERTTVFAEGDEMGMYVISSDGTVICNNEKFVYDGSAWKAANELYYWKNADYIVYYPYDESLTVESILDVDDTASSEETDPSEEMTIVDALKAKFAESADFYTQNTAEAYEKADLMLAEVPKPADGNIQFNLLHQFSMVEINVPVRKYKTKGGFEYTAPVSLNWDTPLTIDGKAVTPYSTGKGSFRFIVPSATNLSLTLDGHLVYDEGVPVNFDSSTESQSVNLASGTCKVYNVTYDKISSEVVTRDLEVGDYYYSDGSIYPYGNQQDDNDLNKPVKNGCIGVVFEVGTGNINDNGTVLALQNTTNINIGNENMLAWGGYTESILSNIVDGGNDESLQTLIDKKDGLTISKQLQSEVASVQEAISFEEQYPTPQQSSGWYLPSTGQLISLVANIGGYKFTTASLRNNNVDRPQKEAAFNKIETTLKLVGGTMSIAMGGVNRWWTTTEVNSDEAWGIEWKGQQTVLVNRQKGQNNQCRVRPVLSF